MIDGGDRWRRIQSVLQDAFDRPPEERSAFVQRACGGDTDLRLEVESLLAADEAAGSFAERAALDDWASSAAAAALEYRPLTSGDRLGPYAITGPLAAGGMGEVYSATDTRLGRTVAVKVLPAHLRADVNLRKRFDREARALARLGHPHICALLDVGRERGIDFLVMEYVEGETLAERLARGPLDVKAAVHIGLQLATALAAAHRGGILHRDLKPSNVMLTSGGAKLLDFGLAHATRSSLERPGSGLTDADHGSTPSSDRLFAPSSLTVQGTLLGTIEYMAPEQLAGTEPDARTDIFALGIVLYEMISATRPFRGAIRDTPAPLTGTPRPVRRVIDRCLATDPEARWQSADAVARELQRVAEAPAWRSVPGGVVTRAAMTTFIVAAAGAAWLWSPFRRDAGPAAHVTKLEVITSANRDFSSLALSPDGRSLVYTAIAEGATRLWLRRLDETVDRPLTGTEDASSPFWAPDGKSIGFFADGRLKKLDLPDGVPEVVADAPSPRGGTWSAAGIIVFAPVAAGGLMSVPVGGGSPVAVVDGGPGRGTPRWPQFLPDGRRFIFYTAAPANRSLRGIYVGSLDGEPARRIVDADGAAVFAPPHWLLLPRQGRLSALRFNPETGLVIGEPVDLAPSVALDAAVMRGAFTASTTGVLAYREPATPDGHQLIWRDRNGRSVGTLGGADDLSIAAPALSPDGKQVALVRRVQGNADIWVLDSSRGVATRLTGGPDSDMQPIWSPRGNELVFASSRRAGNAVTDLFLKPVSDEADRLLFSAETSMYPQSWSPDGGTLLYGTRDPQTDLDIWARSIGDDGRRFPVVRSRLADDLGQFSPDGRWVAYQSNRSGRPEIYVQSFPSPSTVVPVSTHGGVQPRWAPDGRELFYLSAEGEMMSVPIAPTGTTLAAGEPMPLFQARVVESGNTLARESPQYAVAPDGRFLLVSPVGDPVVPSIVIVLNWDSAMK
jgi:Tol biopolymer transport system component